MQQLKYFCILIFLSMGLMGCVGTAKNMAINSNMEDISLPTGEGLALLRVVVTNKYKPKNDPQISMVVFDKIDREGKITENIKFIPDNEGKIPNTGGNTYLLRMYIPSGQYTFRGISFIEKFPFPIMDVYGSLPMLTPVTIKPDTIIYLGTINATILKKKEGDIGIVNVPLPNIPLTMSGFGYGTFHVAIKDNFLEDINLFSAQFPALQNQEILNDVLPERDLYKVKKWTKKIGLLGGIAITNSSL